MNRQSKTKSAAVEKMNGEWVQVEVHCELDIEDFRGCAGYALLLLAANPHLSAPDLQYVLLDEGVERLIRWLQKRRWLFRQPDTGGRKNRDGKDTEAVTIMRANTNLSSKKLAGS